MLHTKATTLGFILMAVFALGACVSDSASAAKPELLEKNGKELVQKGFKLSGKKVTFEVVSTNKKIVKCAAYTAMGTVTGVKAIEIKSGPAAGITFTGCKFENVECTTAGQAAGTVVTSVLVGELEYIKEGGLTKEVGLSLEPKGKISFASFACGCLIEQFTIGEGAGKGGDSVIGLITPIEAFVKPPAEFKVAFSQMNGAQKPKKFEKITSNDFLETEGLGQDKFAYKESGVETPPTEPSTILFEEEAKIT